MELSNVQASSVPLLKISPSAICHLADRLIDIWRPRLKATGLFASDHSAIGIGKWTDDVLYGESFPDVPSISISDWDLMWG